MSQSPEAKLKELLKALDESLVTVTRAAKAARDGIEVRALAPYYAYRASLEEYEAIVMVVRNAASRQSEKLSAQTERILLDRERRFLALSIRSALDFFFALSAIPTLSLGIRECFAQELRSLKSAEQRISAVEHQGALSPDLDNDLMMAREILGEIMAKAPSMLSFD